MNVIKTAHRIWVGTNVHIHTVMAGIRLPLLMVTWRLLPCLLAVYVVHYGNALQPNTEPLPLNRIGRILGDKSLKLRNVQPSAKMAWVSALLLPLLCYVTSIMIFYWDAGIECRNASRVTFVTINVTYDCNPETWKCLENPLKVQEISRNVSLLGASKHLCDTH